MNTLSRSLVCAQPSNALSDRNTETPFMSVYKNAIKPIFCVCVTSLFSVIHPSNQPTECILCSYQIFSNVSLSSHLVQILFHTITKTYISMLTLHYMSRRIQCSIYSKNIYAEASQVEEQHTVKFNFTHCSYASF